MLMSLRFYALINLFCVWAGDDLQGGWKFMTSGISNYLTYSNKLHVDSIYIFSRSHWFNSCIYEVHLSSADHFYFCISQKNGCEIKRVYFRLLTVCRPTVRLNFLSSFQLCFNLTYLSFCNLNFEMHISQFWDHSCMLTEYNLICCGTGRFLWRSSFGKNHWKRYLYEISPLYSNTKLLLRSRCLFKTLIFFALFIIISPFAIFFYW